MITSDSLNINYKKSAVEQTPTMLRQALLMAFLKSAVSQIASTHSQLVQFRDFINYRLEHNGQVCYLRAALNDQFDSTERRIEIGKADQREPAIIFWREMDRLIPDRNNPTLIISRRGYIGGAGFNFVIRVPNNIFQNAAIMQQLRAVVIEYKLASKQFDIIPL